MEKAAPRPGTAKSCVVRARPRYEQIAATSVVQVEEFRGFPDLANKTQLRLPHSQTSSPPTTIRIPVTASVKQILTDKECNRAAADIDNLPDDDPAFLRRVAEYLRLHAQIAAMRGNFEQAMVYREKREKVLEKSKTKPVRTRDEQEKHDCEEGLDRLWNDVDERIDEFDRETDEMTGDLLYRQQEELADLENEWENVVVEQYRKPSPQLIRKRSLEAEMIKRDHIESAYTVHKDIVDLEKKEREEAQYRFRRDYEEVRCAMIQRHDRELEEFLHGRLEQRQKIYYKYSKTEDLMMNRYRVLNNKPSHQTRFPDYYGSGPLQARPAAILRDPTLSLRKKLPMISLGKRRRPASAMVKSSNRNEEDENIWFFETTLQDSSRQRNWRPRSAIRSARFTPKSVQANTLEHVDRGTSPDNQKETVKVDAATVASIPKKRTPSPKNSSHHHHKHRSKYAHAAAQPIQKHRDKKHKYYEKDSESQIPQLREDKRPPTTPKVEKAEVKTSNHRYYRRDSDSDAIFFDFDMPMQQTSNLAPSERREKSPKSQQRDSLGKTTPMIRVVHSAKPEGSEDKSRRKGRRSHKS